MQCCYRFACVLLVVACALNCETYAKVSTTTASLRTADHAHILSASDSYHSRLLSEADEDDIGGNGKDMGDEKDLSDSKSSKKRKGKGKKRRKGKGKRGWKGKKKADIEDLDHFND